MAPAERGGRPAESGGGAADLAGGGIPRATAGGPHEAADDGTGAPGALSECDRIVLWRGVELGWSGRVRPGGDQSDVCRRTRQRKPKLSR